MAARYKGYIACGLSIAIGLVMLVFGAIVMASFGCWSVCEARRLANLSPLLLPGLVVVGTGVLAWRWIRAGTRPKLWAPLLFATMSVLAIVTVLLVIPAMTSDPLALVIPLGLLTLAAAQCHIAIDLWRA